MEPFPSPLQNHNSRGFLDGFQGCCWLFLFPPLPLLPCRWGDIISTDLLLPVSNPGGIPLQDNKGLYLALLLGQPRWFPACAAPCATNCFQVAPAAPCPSCARIPFFPHPNPCSRGWEKHLLLAGFAPSRLVFRGDSSRLAPPPENIPENMRENFPLGKSFMEKRLNTFDLHRSPPLRAELKTRERPAKP